MEVLCSPVDANGDGAADFNNIQPFVTLLLMGSAHGGPCTGDVNGDGRIDDRDLQDFIAAGLSSQ